VSRARRPPAVARVLGRITETVRRHDLFEPGDHVLVWVSGGPDSVCLLESLVRLRRLLRLRLSVFHMDHGLRPDSSSDATYVHRVAARHGLDCRVAHPEHGPRKGTSIEMWARGERMRAAQAIALEIGATRHADGHTMDDQAETVLMGLVLGRGRMSGIGRRNGTLVRPMLDVTRDEVEAFCRALHLRPRRDPTNRDTHLLRNAIRLQAIPAIERATGRSVIETFARTADLQAAEEQALDAIAAEHLDDVWEPIDDGFAVRVRPLAALPAGLAPWVVRRCFQRADVGWDKDAIERVLDLAAGRPARRVDLTAGTKARRDRTRVVVVPAIRPPG
jgi:tRNA(Ile)-lysidine synthase